LHSRPWPCKHGQEGIPFGGHFPDDIGHRQQGDEDSKSQQPLFPTHGAYKEMMSPRSGMTTLV
jgi:hypothetical protein